MDLVHPKVLGDLQLYPIELIFLKYAAHSQGLNPKELHFRS